jgi:putative lipoic acid-binding regulatory protein
MASDTKDEGKGLDYPCDFPVKVFLRPEPGAEAALLKAFTEAVGTTPRSSKRPSSNGKYLCVSLNFTATDAEQVERMRAAIAAQPAVVLAL